MKRKLFTGLFRTLDSSIKSKVTSQVAGFKSFHSMYATILNVECADQMVYGITNGIILNDELYRTDFRIQLFCIYFEVAVMYSGE